MVITERAFSYAWITVVIRVFDFHIQSGVLSTSDVKCPITTTFVTLDTSTGIALFAYETL